MAAVVVNELVLQRERVEAATRAALPGNLLRLRREPALRDVLFDHDDLLVSPQGLGNSGAVQRLHGMRRDDRDRLALLGDAISDLDRHLRDDAEGKHADIAATPE